MDLVDGTGELCAAWVVEGVSQAGHVELGEVT
jgi:hypothetical protein